MRTVPAPLQAHLNNVDTTTTRLLKITLKSGVTYGLAMLDRNVTYDDGEYEGEITYIATNGFDASTLSGEIGYSVDNSEGYALVSDVVPGITTEMADAGELDDATWVCYLVNYEDLSQGHVILDAGDLGEVRTRHGMIWIPELLSYVMRLRQPIGGVWSRQCRAIFGTPADSQTGCGIDLEPLWVNGEVLTVGAESDRVFQGDTVLDSSAGVIPEPGRVQWLTGVNAGREYAVESIDGDDVELSEPTLYAIQVGDTYRIRPDCKKQYIRDCIGVWANGINFKGEPYIPVGDAASIQIPGAQQPVGGGYVGEPSAPVEEPSAPDAPPAGDPSEWWPNWPIMNCTVLQGSSATTILDYARHDELADKDVVVLPPFNPTDARLQGRSEAMDAVNAINPNTKFLNYTGVQQALKVDADSNLQVQRDLIASATEGHANWYVHRVGQPSSVVESYFDPTTLRMCNVARGAGLNSLGETYVQALWRKWDVLLDDPTWNVKSRLRGFFQDDYNARPPDMYASNGTVTVTDYDFNANGVADGRADFSAGPNAGGRMWAEGHLDSKAAMESRFAGRLLIPNFGQTMVDYFDGEGVPPLPISDHPFYQQFEVGFTESCNNQLGISKTSTAYEIEAFGSVSHLMRSLAILVAWLKPDSQNTITGKGCILLHANCVDRTTPTSSDYTFARFIAALALLNERVATCVQQQPDLPLSLDETLLELGSPIGTRSMGSLNQSNVAFTLRTADFSSGVARFHWAVFEKGGVLARTDRPTVGGAYPSADATVSCTLPTPPSGKKNQRINAATYENPNTGRAMRGQDTTLNSGADVTSITLRPYEAFFWRIVDV